MGGTDYFGLRLDGEGVHFCGQLVTGKVILQTDEELTNINKIKVKLKGEGDVHWTERVSSTSYQTITLTSKHNSELILNVLSHNSQINVISFIEIPNEGWKNRALHSTSQKFGGLYQVSNMK